MIHFCTFSNFSENPKQGQKFQPSDKIPKSESTAQASNTFITSPTYQKW